MTQDLGRRITVEVVGLTKRYGSATAVDNVSFTVRPGAVTGFLGPNGAGKTTTLKMILGLTKPTAGTVSIGGTRYRDLARPWRVVGSMLDTQRAHPNRTAYQHLRWLALSNGMGTGRIGKVLSQVGLESAADTQVRAYSLGMSQRLGIAAALLGEPRVLLLDEPTNGLDPAGIVWVRNLLRELADDGRSVLVSSHQLSEVARTADHVVVIGRGKVLADSTLAEFTAGGSLEEAFLSATAEHRRYCAQQVLA